MLRKSRMSAMNAVDLLKSDHEKVKGMFEEFESTRTSRIRMQLLQQIIEELTLHTAVEEELVYPLFKNDQEEADEAYEEHHVVKMMLEELKNADAKSFHLKAKVKVLSEMVQHHIEEEESTMLPKLKRQYKTDLNGLGEQIQARKEQLKNGGQGMMQQAPQEKPRKSQSRMTGGMSKGKGTTTRGKSTSASSRHKKAG